MMVIPMRWYLIVFCIFFCISLIISNTEHLFTHSFSSQNSKQLVSHIFSPNWWFLWVLEHSCSFPSHFVPQSFPDGSTSFSTRGSNHPNFSSSVFIPVWIWNDVTLTDWEHYGPLPLLSSWTRLLCPQEFVPLSHTHACLCFCLWASLGSKRSRT